MRAELVAHTLELPYARPFRIARWGAELSTDTTVLVELRAPDGRVGLGEAAADTFFGETPGTVHAVLPLLFEALAPLGEPPDSVADARAWLAAAVAATEDAIAHNRGAKCGLDIALHDLVAQRLALPLYGLLGTEPSGPPTDFTLGLGEPAEVAAHAAERADFPALKLKLGGGSDLELVQAVRGRYDGPLRVDANTGWGFEQACAMVARLAELGVELVEQPLHPRDDALLPELQRRSPLPIVVDESFAGAHDLDRFEGVAGVNVKLTKAGGVGPALAAMRAARERGFRVLLGCTDVTSVGVAAAAALASLADWVDLDAPLLLADEPFVPLELDDGKRWLLPDEPGLGVRLRRQLG